MTGWGNLKVYDTCRHGNQDAMGVLWEVMCALITLIMVEKRAEF